MFTEAATAGVSDAVRETVQAVADLLAERRTSRDGSTQPSVTKTDVARRLGLPKDTRYLVNLTGRKSLPARLALGDPLPEDRAVLPDVRDLLAPPAVPGASGRG